MENEGYQMLEGARMMAVSPYDELQGASEYSEIMEIQEEAPAVYDDIQDRDNQPDIRAQAPPETDPTYQNDSVKHPPPGGATRLLKLAFICLVVLSLAGNVVLVVLYVRAGTSCSCTCPTPFVQSTETSLSNEVITTTKAYVQSTEASPSTEVIATQDPSPIFYNISDMASYNLPYEVSGVTETSQGDLVMVERHGRRTAVFTKQGQLKYNITIPGARNLYRVARRGQVLFVTDWNNGLVHVVRESGIYITSFNTSLTHSHGIAVDGDILWLTNRNQGLYKLTIDASYNLITSTLFAPYTSVFNLPIGITLHGSRIIVVCLVSDNIHIFNTNGSRVVSPVGGQGSGDGQLHDPIDVVTDTAGHIYIADKHNHRIVLFAPTCQFIKNLVTQDDGLVGYPVALYLHGNTLYVTTSWPNKLYVIQLT